MKKVNKEQVKWYFEQTFYDYWEVIADFLNSDNETKEVMKKDIYEQTKNRTYKGERKEAYNEQRTRR
tara:strand:- start:142 stop:342 length:201 start_codon:yes stop_codon:yes gene_type:complete